MVKLSHIKKGIMMYYYNVDHVWTTSNDHSVDVVCYDENNDVIHKKYFCNLQEYLDEIEINNEEYDSIEVKYDPITIQFPCSRKKSLRY